MAKQASTSMQMYIQARSDLRHHEALKTEAVVIKGTCDRGKEPLSLRGSAPRIA